MSKPATSLIFLGSRVEITGGVVRSATVTDENGTRHVLTNLGSRRFFVNVVEADGACVSMWDGDNHAAAREQARVLSLDFGPVHDVTGGAA